MFNIVNVCSHFPIPIELIIAGFPKQIELGTPIFILNLCFCYF